MGSRIEQSIKAIAGDNPIDSRPQSRIEHLLTSEVRENINHINSALGNRLKTTIYEVVPSTAIDSSNGETVNNSSYVSTPPIAIKVDDPNAVKFVSFETNVVLKDNYGLAFYDKDIAYISGIGGNTEGYRSSNAMQRVHVPIPDNAYFVRVCIRKYQYDESASATEAFDAACGVLGSYEQYLTLKAKTPADAGAHQMLVTDENGVSKWEDKMMWVGPGFVPMGKQTGYSISNYYSNAKSYYGSVTGNLRPNEEFKITWDGVDYIVIPDNNGACGNPHLMSVDEEDNGLPFYFTNATKYAKVYANTSGTHYIKFWEHGNEYRTFGNEYIPQSCVVNYAQYKEQSLLLGNQEFLPVAGSVNPQQSFAVFSNKASGTYSTAMGLQNEAKGQNSFCIGMNNVSYAPYSFVTGKYANNDTSKKYAFIIGNGTNASARADINTVDWNGNGWFAGTVEGTGVIVKSSTEGSSKRFKISVDDSGTITATEVTA